LRNVEDIKRDASETEKWRSGVEKGEVRRGETRKES